MLLAIAMLLNNEVNCRGDVQNRHERAECDGECCNPARLAQACNHAQYLIPETTASQGLRRLLLHCRQAGKQVSDYAGHLFNQVFGHSGDHMGAFTVALTRCLADHQNRPSSVGGIGGHSSAQTQRSAGVDNLRHEPAGADVVGRGVLGSSLAH